MLLGTQGAEKEQRACRWKNRPWTIATKLFKCSKWSNSKSFPIIQNSFTILISPTDNSLDTHLIVSYSKKWHYVLTGVHHFRVTAFPWAGAADRSDSHSVLLSTQQISENTSGLVSFAEQSCVVCLHCSNTVVHGHVSERPGGRHRVVDTVRSVGNIRNGTRGWNRTQTNETQM